MRVQLLIAIALRSKDSSPATTPQFKHQLQDVLSLESSSGIGWDLFVETMNIVNLSTRLGKTVECCKTKLHQSGIKKMDLNFSTT